MEDNLRAYQKLKDGLIRVWFMNLKIYHLM